MALVLAPDLHGLAYASLRNYGLCRTSSATTPRSTTGTFLSKCRHPPRPELTIINGACSRPHDSPGFFTDVSRHLPKYFTQVSFDQLELEPLTTPSFGCSTVHASRADLRQPLRLSFQLALTSIPLPLSYCRFPARFPFSRLLDQPTLRRPNSKTPPTPFSLSAASNPCPSEVITAGRSSVAYHKYGFVNYL